MSTVASVLSYTVPPFVTFALGIIASNRYRLWRLLRRYDDVQVHVETDPRIIYANSPPWVTFPQFVPLGRDDLPDAPYGAIEMNDWAANIGGVPAGTCDLQVTILAWKDQSIVVDALRVTATEYSIPSGVMAIYPVGGAELETRRLDVELSTFVSTVTPTEPGGTPGEMFSFFLAAGKRARFNLQVHASLEAPEDIDAFAWTATLELLVGNKRKQIAINDKGKPFVLVNHDRHPTYYWDQKRWAPEDEFLSSS